MKISFLCSRHCSFFFSAFRLKKSKQAEFIQRKAHLLKARHMKSVNVIVVGNFGASEKCSLTGRSQEKIENPLSVATYLFSTVLLKNREVAIIITKDKAVPPVLCFLHKSLLYMKNAIVTLAFVILSEKNGSVHETVNINSSASLWLSMNQNF